MQGHAQRPDALTPASQNVDPSATSGNNLPTRRRVLTSSLAGATAWTLAPHVAAQATQVSGSLGGISPRRRDPLLTLVQRTTQGFTAADYETAKSLGYQGWLEAQLDPGSIDDSDLDAQLAGLETLNLTAKELFDNYGPATNLQSVPPQQLTGAAVLRNALSGRQLYERMVEFWTDHFNVPNGENPINLLKTVDDREVIRPHALGKFRDLLHASAKSAAMLSYLDNVSNVAGAPNENYAREVMELHTLGVDGPYFENDVRELAKCFTGWSFFPPQFPNYGEFVFRANQHDTTEKNLLGLTIPAGGGVEDAETVLDYLASHPATAAYVSGKLVRWLVGYEPSQELIDEVAQAFLDTDGDIKDMIRVALRQDNLEREEPWAEPKLKRPFHLAMSILRGTSANILNPGALAIRLNSLGQRPFAWPAPDGYPDDIDVWGSAVQPRWQLAFDLVDGALTGISVPVGNLLDLIDGAPLSGVAAALNESLTGGLLTREEELGIQAYLNGAGSLSIGVLREAVALVMSTPSYQYY